MGFKIVKIHYTDTPIKSKGKKGLHMEYGRNIDEDRRMAAFLASRNYKGETWKTQEMLYYDWVEAGGLMTVDRSVRIKGFEYKGYEDMELEEDMG